MSNMSHTSMILTGIMMMALLVFVAPNIFALNRGHILRNMALWLAIFMGLALIYQSVGPDSPHPLFQLPQSMQGMKSAPVLTSPAANPAPAPDAKPKSDSEPDGFTPPRED